MKPILSCLAAHRRQEGHEDTRSPYNGRAPPHKTCRMTLANGSRLGSYEILAPLGAGGMGEVYRARDTKLGRAVAVKVLPEAFAFDPERVTRFEREARLLASLNHPHIAALYGMEESGGQHFLVMELVEGETLADRLRRGPIPCRSA
jgi:serine/threonine protein kinase